MSKTTKTIIRYIAYTVIYVILSSCSKGDVELAVVANGTAGPLSWKITEDEVLIISGKGEMSDYYYHDYETPVISPWYPYSKKVKAIVIDEGITRIGNYAFDDFTNVINVIIPNSLTSIGEEAFYKCSGLIKIDLPKDINIENGAFYGCSNLTSGTIGALSWSISTDGTTLSLSGTGQIIDNGYNCNPWVEKNYYIKKMFVGDGILKLESSMTFSAYHNLTNIEVAEGNPNYATEDGVLFNKSKEILLVYPCGIQGNYIMPNSVKSIGEQAFRECTGLKEITFSNNLTSIGYSAFNWCEGLVSVVLPSSLTSIGRESFNDCWNLKSLTIPKNIKNIEYAVFYGCHNLTSVTIMATSPPVFDDCECGIASFYNVNDTLYVPKGRVNAYKASDWSEAFTVITEQR